MDSSASCSAHAAKQQRSPFDRWFVVALSTAVLCCVSASCNGDVVVATDVVIVVCGCGCGDVCVGACAGACRCCQPTDQIAARLSARTSVQCLLDVI